ncbi:ankyrin repeat-containing domain protein [Aspergillus heterothallicus]
MSRTTRPTLGTLPAEILYLIARFLNVASLNSLLQTCQRFHWLFDSLLYEQGRKYINLSNGGTPLIWAVQHNRTTVLKRLLKGDTWPSDNQNGTTALHQAVSLDNYEALKILIASEADLLILDSNSDTPLDLAASINNERATQLLIDTNLSATPWPQFERRWQQALAKAVRAQHEPVARLLLECTTTSAPRRLVSDMANMIMYHIAASHGHCGIIRLLCEYGATPARSPAGSRTLLHPTARNGHVDAMKLALELGADPLMLDTDGMSALHLAAEAGHLSAMDVLLDAGVPVDILATGGSTPLLSAAMGGHEPAAKLLLDRGADPRKRNTVGFNALDLTIPKHPPPALVALLLASGTDVSPPESEIRMTPLHWAARTGQCDTLALLLRAGAPIHRVDQRGRTGLHLAVREGHGDAVGVLLEEGADPNVLDETDCTPLDLARLSGCEEMADRLVRAGAVVKVFDLGDILRETGKLES